MLKENKIYYLWHEQFCDNIVTEYHKLVEIDLILLSLLGVSVDEKLNYNADRHSRFASSSDQVP